MDTHVKKATQKLYKEYNYLHKLSLMFSDN